MPRIIQIAVLEPCTGNFSKSDNAWFIYNAIPNYDSKDCKKTQFGTYNDFWTMTYVDFVSACVQLGVDGWEPVGLNPVNPKEYLFKKIWG